HAVDVDLQRQPGLDRPVVADAALPATGVVHVRLLQEEAAHAAVRIPRQDVAELVAEALAELGVDDRRDGGVGAVGDRPVERDLRLEALAVGEAEAREEKAGLPLATD